MKTSARNKLMWLYAVIGFILGNTGAVDPRMLAEAAKTLL